MNTFEKYAVSVLMLVLTPILVYIAFVIGLGEWNIELWTEEKKSIFLNMSILSWILTVIFINKIK